MLDFGLQVDQQYRVQSTGPRQKKKKIRAVEKCKVAFLATTCPKVCFQTLRTSLSLGQVIPYPSKPIQSEKMVRESEPKKNSSWKAKCWPEEFPFWTNLLNDFQSSFLRFFDVFPYFHVWGSQKCQETILFRKKSWSF